MSYYQDKPSIARTPTASGLSYRLVGRGDYVPGTGVEISGSGISFNAVEPLEQGRAAEVRLVPEDRIIPPLIAYIEVVRCERKPGAGFLVSGRIKGIKSE